MARRYAPEEPEDDGKALDRIAAVLRMDDVEEDYLGSYYTERLKMIHEIVRATGRDEKNPSGLP